MFLRVWHNYTSLRWKNILYTYDKRVNKEMEPTNPIFFKIYCWSKNLHTHTNSECFIISAYVDFLWRYRTRKVGRKIQIRDHSVTLAIFIENSNNVQFFIQFI